MPTDPLDLLLPGDPLDPLTTSEPIGAVLVSIERPIRTGDGAGGKRIVWETVGTAFATQNYYNSLVYSETRLEQAAHGTQGPGVEVKTKMVFDFATLPLPTILEQYRIVPPDGLHWVVQFVQTFDDHLQVHAEILA